MILFLFKSVNLVEGRVPFHWHPLSLIQYQIPLGGGVVSNLNRTKSAFIPTGTGSGNDSNNNGRGSKDEEDDKEEDNKEDDKEDQDKEQGEDKEEED